MTEDFYQKEPVPGGEAKFIRDEGVAHELAIIEATGRDRALAREQELKRRHETGLTDQERKTISFNEGLAAKYPHAFSVDIGENGKIYYDLKPVLDEDWQGSHRLGRVILTQEGILDVGPLHRNKGKSSDREFVEAINGLYASTLAEAADRAIEAGNKRRASNKHFVTPDTGKAPIDLENEYINLGLSIGGKDADCKIRRYDPFGNSFDNLSAVSMQIKQVEADQQAFKEKAIKSDATVSEALDRF